MTTNHPELNHAEELLENCQFREAFAITEQVGSQKGLSLEDHLYCMWLKMHIRGHQIAFNDCERISKLVFQESCAQGNLLFQFDAIFWKCMTLLDLAKIPDFFLKLDQINDLYKKNSKCILPDDKLKIDFLLELLQIYKKSLEGDAGGALEKVELLVRKIKPLKKYKIYFGLFSQHLAFAHMRVDNFHQSLKYNQNCVDIDYKNSEIFFLEGEIYRQRGNFKISLDNFQQGLAMAQKDKIPERIMSGLTSIACIHLWKAELTQALEFLKKSQKIAEKYNLQKGSNCPLFIQISLEMGDIENAHKYFTSFKQYVDEKHPTYRRAHALILSKSKRSRDRVKAEEIYRQLQKEGGFVHKELCILLLYELHQTSDQEIVKEIETLTQEMIDFGRKEKAYPIQAIAHLFKGRLALIQLNFDEAQKYLTKAQQIADEHDLPRWAQQISAEHDKLLRELAIWENIKQSQIPFNSKLKMESTKDIISRMLNSPSLYPPKLEEELPLLLIIMTSGGTPIFVQPFSDAWGTQEAMFSSFLSAVSSWGKGVFAKSIDRMTFGNNIILMYAVEPFTICYVIQGQSYPAQQKLTRFVSAIQQHSEVWKALLLSKQTNLLLDTANPPALGTLVVEIFSKNVEGAQ
jgi:tetratricopeptide (TPR) repeat protein